jgi:cbb3-type cytochrome oxidase maturation protein
MSVLILLIASGGAVASGFLIAFVWAVRSGQFDDTCTPAVRVLFDIPDSPPRLANPNPVPGIANPDTTL